MRNSLLGGLSSKTFLDKHWQKKPLLVRQAFPGFKDLVTPDELAGLACEEGVRSRLIFEKGGKKPWRVENGPFPEAKMRKLPREGWALLVQDLNVHLEHAALFLDEFGFLPHWRLDDLMASFAPPGGGVGPHVDSYDVFLIQGLGRRRWQIAETFDPTMVAGVDLRILANFEPEQDWILEPGDMLYLPPGVAHHGIALEPCITYSVGFRAPPKRELARSFFQLPDEALPGEGELYGDPDLKLAEHPAHIGADAVARLRAVLQGVMNDDETLARWLGAAVTSAQSPYLWELESGAKTMARATPAKQKTFEAQLAKHRWLWRADRDRIALHVGREVLYTFVGGSEMALPLETRDLVELVTRARRVETAKVRAALPKGTARTAALAWLAALKSEGAIYLAGKV